VNAVARFSEVELEPHPPYRDPGLTGELGQIFHSDDGCFKAVYWVAQGPGKLLEQPKANELLCVLEGEVLVERRGEQTRAGPGDVILWLKDDPPLITVQERLTAFCVVYNPSPKAAEPAGQAEA